MPNKDNSPEKPPLYIRHFFWILIAFSLLGASAALVIPSTTGWFRQSHLSNEVEQKSISDLRLHILYITGGAIAILTLLQTNWKNYNENIKNTHDIAINYKRIDMEERSRWKDILDSRRDKFTNFKDNLKGLSGDNIEEFIHFVNIWITDTPTTYIREAEYESQRIIDALCSTLKESGNNSTQNIIFTLKKLSTIYKMKQQKGSLWYILTYDFSGISIDEPMHDMCFHNMDFSNSRFAPNTGFTSCTFSGKCTFLGAHTSDNFHIISSKFAGELSFINCKFESNIRFFEIEMSDDDSLTFMDAIFFKDSVFEKFTSPQKHLINLGHAFTKTYFSNNHTHIFKDIDLEITLVPRKFKDKSHKIPNESILLDPLTNENDLKLPELSPTIYNMM